MKYQNEIIRIIKETIQMASKIDNINLNSMLIDIGFDSVACVRLLVELEKYFHVTFPDTTLSISREFKVRDLCGSVNSAIQDTV